MNTKSVIYTRAPFNSFNALLGMLSLGTITVFICTVSLLASNGSVSPLFLEWIIVGLAGSFAFGALLGYCHVPAIMVKVVPPAVIVSCAMLATYIFYIL